ncbi:MAG TPA: pyridoxal 5'-phosphate synthase glutaminase subunit PdxT [Abditibacterium sp.]
MKTDEQDSEKTAISVGVLALQGDYGAHQRLLEGLGAQVHLVRRPQDLEAIDGLLIPGGESTVMSRLCERYDLLEPLRAKIGAGMPTFGTCAGLIFLAREIGGASLNFPQTTLGMLDVRVERNAYGAQIDSFETDLSVAEIGENVRAVFIRAPRIAQVGANVEILAKHENAPVLVRQGTIIALSFHPEIAGENRIHQMWIETVQAAQNSATSFQKAVL